MAETQHRPNRTGPAPSPTSLGNAGRQPDTPLMVHRAGRQGPLDVSASPTMRRFWPYLALFIAAALLNVLVAWGCILWSPYTRHTEPSGKPDGGGYPPTLVGPYAQQAWWFTADGFGVSEAVPSGARGAEGHFLYWRGSHTPAYYRGGWPMRSTESTVTFHDYLTRWHLPVREILRRGMQTSWLPTWLHAQEGRRLPVVPFWPGFAINTLLYFVMFVSFRLACLRVVRKTHANIGPSSRRPASPLNAGQ